MPVVPLTRAYYACQVIEILRSAGAPVERRLAEARLPLDLDTTPEAWIGLHLLLDFCDLSARHEGIDDIGWLGARRIRYEDLGPRFLHEAQSAVNGLARLRLFLRHAAEEDTVVKVDLRREGDFARVICDLVLPSERDRLVHSEWAQIAVILSIVRTVAGPDWCPPELTFTSRFVPSESARDCFGTTRMLVGQPHASFTVPLSLLAAPLRPDGQATGRAEKLLPDVARWHSAAPNQSFVDLMKQAMAPYLETGEATLFIASEIAGMSTRTLQRTLSHSGCSFSDLIGEVRFERACELLADPDAKIIEVAIAAGYQNHAHFSRAFRRMTGISPREYRGNVGPAEPLTLN